MFYVVAEKIKDDYFKFVTDKKGIARVFKTKKQANIERIYLQPDYNNKLQVLTAI